MSDDVEQPDEAATEDSTAEQPDEAADVDDQAAQKLADAEARADKYARALFDARVAATGRLADPTDMPFNAALVDDADALSKAIDALLAAKPHLASRKPVWGDVGAGQSKDTATGPSFADLLRGG